MFVGDALRLVNQFRGLVRKKLLLQGCRLLRSSGEPRKEFRRLPRTKVFQQLLGRKARKVCAQTRGLAIERGQPGPLTASLERSAHASQRFERGSAHTDLAAEHALNLCEGDHWT